MKEIAFSNNWNKKLCCNFFTTIRLNKSHVIGEEIMIKLKDKELGKAVIIQKKLCLLSELTEYTAHLDTGYNFEKTCALIMKMNKAKNVDWNVEQIAVYLIGYSEQNKLPCISQNEFIKEVKDSLPEKKTNA